MNSSDNNVSDNNVVTLPNGMTVHQHRSYETEFIYREIFEDHIYTGPFQQSLKKNTAPLTVVDVGANIGLFARHIKDLFADARILAFEPAPVHFQLLQKNLAELPDTLCLASGLGSTKGEASFTYYPDYSLLSGFHGDTDSDQALLQAGIASQLNLDVEDSDSGHEKYLQLLSDGKLDNMETFQCPITTISAIIERQALQQIDLLKIDAEKSELAILKGVDEAHWQMIKHLAIEAHSEDCCKQLETLLLEKNYRVEKEKTSSLINSSEITASTFMIYGWWQE